LKRSGRLCRFVNAYQRSRNKLFLIQYHLVWCPKRRKPVLVGEVKERLEEIIHQVADELEIKVLEFAINPDHVRLFISAYPTIPVHKNHPRKLPTSLVVESVNACNKFYMYLSY